MRSKVFVAGFVKNSFVDWPGKICSVIFLGGCNFDCWYCHNRDILCHTSNTIPLDEVLAKIKEQVGFIDGVCISGGEPTMHPHLREIIAAVREIKIPVDDILKISKIPRAMPIKLDTNGSNSALVQDLVKTHMVDFVAMDIKAPVTGPNKHKYSQIAGVPVDLGEIRASIKILEEVARRAGVGIMFRTTPCPELTDEDLESIKKALGKGTFWRKNHFENPK